MKKRRLTERQKEHLEDLTRNTRLFVGFNSPSIIRSFDILVDKGYAEMVEQNLYGKHYQAKEKQI